MKPGIIGRIFPRMFSKVVFGYTARAVPELNIKEFKKKHRKEYEAMAGRNPSAGAMKDNMLAPVIITKRIRTVSRGKSLTRKRPTDTSEA